MPLFDPNKMTRLVSELRKNVVRLKILAGFSPKAFLADPDKMGSAKYSFIVAIECCIDMCNHIISKNGYRVPEDYADTFNIMAEAGVLNSEFADNLKNMARFRNRIVHLYWEVDDRQVYQYLNECLDDFDKLIFSIATFLGWREL